MNNILTRTDSYKVSHIRQYPWNTQAISSYIEARWSREHPAIQSTVFFGLQAYLKSIAGCQVNQDMIDNMADKMSRHGLPFDSSAWEYIIKEHNGRLPIKIKAAPEGTNIPLSNALVRIENTDEKCFWLPSWLETSLLRAIWYPTTVATISHYCRQIIGNYLEQSGDIAGLPFKLHDFGARGVSSGESAEIGGAAHLLNFLGSDTIESIDWLEENYHAIDMPCFSIPAAEHSTMTSWGGRDGELLAVDNMIEQFAKPDKMVAIVSDSYDLFALLKQYGTKFKKKIENSGSTIIVRPDSGNPVEISLKSLEVLGKYFAPTVNNKGYKVLPPYIRLIYGDGMDPEMIDAVCKNLIANKWSIDNIAFGMGGGLLQKVNRDTFGWAMKASAIQIDDKWLPVFKEPKTMTAKNSKRGRQGLFYSSTEDKFKTVNLDTDAPNLTYKTVMREVFYNGKILIEEDLDQIRSRNESFR